MLTNAFFVDKFDDVALFELVEVAQHDAAFVTGLDFADVVGEPFEALATGPGDLLLVANNADVRTPPEGSIQDEAASDTTETARLKELADFGVTIDLSFVDGFEHALEGFVHVFEDLVDDVVGADFDAGGFGLLADPSTRVLKATMIPFDASASMTSLSLTGPVAE